MKKSIIKLFIILGVLVPFIQAEAKTEIKASAVSNSYEVKSGEEILITFKMHTFNDVEKGINAYKATLVYDENIFEKVYQSDFISLNGWESLKYNPNTQELVAINRVGVKDPSEIVQIRLKVRDNILPQDTEVTFADVAVSEGKADLNVFNEKAVISAIKVQETIPTIGTDDNTNNTDNKDNKTENNVNSGDSSTTNDRNTNKNEKTEIEDIKAVSKKNEIRYVIVISVIALEIGVLAYWFIKKKNKNKNNKTNLHSFLFFTTIGLVSLQFVGTVVALAVNYSLLGELNGDYEVNYADAELLELYLINSENIDKAYIENADMNGDNKITITDLTLLVQKLEKTLDYEITFTNVSLDNYSYEKNAEVILKFAADVSYGATIENVVINGTTYKVETLSDGTYQVVLKASDRAGIQNINIEKVILNNEKVIKTAKDVNIDVLKEIPEIKNWSVGENFLNEELDITFDLNDKDASITKARIVITDSNDKEIVVQNITNGQNKVTVPAVDGEKYEANIVVEYDLTNADFSDKDKYTGALTVTKDLQFNIDYQFKVGSFKAYQNGKELMAIEKNAAFQLGFVSSNSTSHEPSAVIINGHRYDDIQKVQDHYEITVKEGIENLGENEFKLEEIILDNGKSFKIDNDNVLKLTIIKRAPIISEIKTNEDIVNNLLNVQFDITDYDKTILGVNVILFNANNEEITRYVFTEEEIENKQFNRDLPTEVTEKYYVKVIASYSCLEDAVGGEELVVTKEVTAQTRLDIEEVKTEKVYFNKGEKVALTYRVNTNKSEDIARILVNNEECIAIKLSDNLYQVILEEATRTAGVKELKAKKFIYSDGVEITSQNNVQIEVLKDKPTITIDDQEDNTDDSTVTIYYTLTDNDDSFVSGEAILTKNSDKSVKTQAIEPGSHSVTFAVDNAEPYSLKMEIEYDRDTNKEDKENQYREVLASEIVELISDYQLKVFDITTKKYLAKDEKIELSFASTNISMFKPIEAIINGKLYTLESENNRYKVIIDGYKEAGVKDIKIESIVLENYKHLEIKENNQVQIEVLKDKPKATNFGYTENEDSTITAKFNLENTDNSFTKGKIDVLNEQGVVVANDDVIVGENTLTFKKTTSEYYIFKVFVDYDLDTNTLENGKNEITNELILSEEMNIGERFLEMKNVLGMTLFTQKGNKVEKISNVNIADLQDLSKYIVQVNLKDDRDFYTTIKDYKIEDGLLKFILDYDNVVQYNGNSRINQLEITFGSINGDIASNIDVDTLIELIKQDPDGSYKVNADFDAKNITSGKAIIPQEFTGTIDFQGHTIKNMSIPLFDSLKDATIENLVIIDSRANANGLLANNITNATIKNVHMKNVQLSTINDAGSGLFGGIIKNSQLENISATNVNVGSAKRLGGIVGMMYTTTIKNGFISGTLNANNDAVGGVVGEAYDNSIIENFYTNVMTNYNGKGGSRGGFVGHPKGLTLTNCISLSQAKLDGYGLKVYGSYQNSKISDKSTKVYELSTSNMVSQENIQGIKVVTPEQLKTKEFYTKTLGWSEDVWDLSQVSSGQYPTLKAYQNTDNAKMESNTVDGIFIPDLARIKNLANYDATRNIAYHNMYKLMPFYDAKYYVEDGNILDVNHILNTKVIKDVYAYDANGNQVVALAQNNKSTIKTIRVIFEDDDTAVYHVSLKDSGDRIAVYDINELDIDYMYSKYLINTKSKVYSYIVDRIKKLNYVNNIASLTSETESRIFVENYAHVKDNADSFALKLLANVDEYSISVLNEILENKVIQDLENNYTLEKLLYAYNYYDRFYNIQIGGINISDIVYFDGNIFSDKLNPLSVSLTMVDMASDKERMINEESKLPSYFNKYIKPLTNDLSVGPFIEYFIKNLTIDKYKNDPASWIVDNYSGTVYEAQAERHPEIRYRVWDHLKARDLLILPILSYHGEDLYILGIPTCIMVGNLDEHEYLNALGKATFAETTKAERMTLLTQFADKATKFYDSIAGVTSEKGYGNMVSRTMINYDKTSNKNWSNEENVKPVYKAFFEVLNKYTVHSAASAYANGTDIYWIYSALTFYSIFTHEAIHNQDGNTFLDGTGRRAGANAEYFTDGFLTQGAGEYGIVPNYTYDYNFDTNIATNFNFERINTREEIEDFYKKMFDVYAALDYLEAQVFLKLTPEEQSKIARVVEETSTDVKLNDKETITNISTKLVTKTAEDFKKMKLKNISDLWDNKIVIPREGTSLLGSANWYVVHNDNGLVEKGNWTLIAYQMLADFGYDGYSAYAGWGYKTDLEALKAVSNYKNWKEYQLDRYKKIEEKLNNSTYLNKDTLMKEIETKVKNDIANNVQNSKTSSMAIFRQMIYGHIKRITNDFESDIFNTNVDKIHIKNAEDFRNLIESNLHGEFILDNDIDVSSITEGNAIIREAFYGSLDGNNHIITGIKLPLFAKLTYASVTNLNIENASIITAEIDCGALAKVISNSQITNVAANNINITTSAKQAGGLIGSASRSYMKNVHINTVNVSGTDRTGGLTGYGTQMIVEECSSNGNVDATGNAVGGFFGQFDNSIATNSYALGTIKGHNDVGGFVGWAEGSTVIKNCLSKVDVTATGAMGGGFIGQILNTGRIENSISLGNGTHAYKFDGRSGKDMFNNFKNNYELEEPFGLSTLNRTDVDSFKDKITSIRTNGLTNNFYTNTLGWDANIWNLSKVESGKLPSLNSKLDTNSDINIINKIEIATVDDFLKISDAPDKYYELTADLDFEGRTFTNIFGIDAIIIETFTGKLEGNNYTIKNLKGYTLFNDFEGSVSNLRIKDFTNIKPNAGEWENVSAFANNSNGATFKNMRFENITLEGKHRVAPVVAVDDKNSAFENISVVNAKVKGTGVYISTFIGRKYGGSIKNVYVEGTIECFNTENGGIVGALQLGGLVENVVSKVDVIKTSDNRNKADSIYNAGFVGNIYNAPRIKNSIAFGKMTGYTKNDEDFVPYKFTGTVESTILNTLENCYEYAGAIGFSRVTDATKGKLDVATEKNVHDKNFYKDTLHFDETIWNLDTVSSNGYPTLK